MTVIANTMSHCKAYKCSSCPKTFSQYNQYVVHMRQHTGEKPFTCEYCKKGFASAKVLKVHVRTHTGERPYQCPYCDRRFSAYANLVVHRRIHTNEKPYVCELCGRAFEHSGNLSRHSQAHRVNEMFRCILCNKTFQSGDGLLEHTKKVHTIDYERYLSHAKPPTNPKSPPKKVLKPKTDVENRPSLTPELSSSSEEVSTTSSTPDIVISKSNPQTSTTHEGSPTSHRLNSPPQVSISPVYHIDNNPEHLAESSSRTFTELKPSSLKRRDIDVELSQHPVYRGALRMDRPPERHYHVTNGAFHKVYHSRNQNVTNGHETHIQAIKRSFTPPHRTVPDSRETPRSPPPLIPINSIAFPDDPDEFERHHKKFKSSDHHEFESEMELHREKSCRQIPVHNYKHIDILVRKLTNSVKSCFQEVVRQEQNVGDVWNHVERMFVSTLHKSELNIERCLEVNSEQLLIHFLDAVGENPCADVRVSEKKRMEINVSKLVHLSFNDDKNKHLL